jgi:hypothetical protein
MLGLNNSSGKSKPDPGTLPECCSERHREDRRKSRIAELILSGKSTSNGHRKAIRMQPPPFCRAAIQRLPMSLSMNLIRY